MDDFSMKKTGKFKLLAFFLVIASLSVGAFFETSTPKEITMTIDYKRIGNIETTAETVGDALEEKGVELTEDMYVNFDEDEVLEDDMHIVVKSPRKYILNDGGNKTEVESVFLKTEDILKDLDIKLGENDYTLPKAKSNVRLGNEIKIFRVEEKVEEIEEEIPFKEVTKDDANLKKGTTKIVEDGQNGLKKIKIKKTFENGELIAEEVIDESVVKEVKDKIIHKGTKVEQKAQTNNKTSNNSKQPSRGSDFKAKKSITMNATAYDDTPESQGKWVGTTAMGTKPRPGVVAVDPRVIPLGTRLYIESLDGTPDYGYAVAEDTGGAIKGNRIDLFFVTRSEVRRFGRRKVRVHILQ